MHIITIGCGKSGVLLLSRLLLLCHVTHRTSDSLQNRPFVESLQEIIVAFQALTQWVEHPYGSVMCKVPAQGQVHSRIMRAQSDVIKL